MDDLASEKDATANDMAPLQPLDVKPGECRLELCARKHRDERWDTVFEMLVGYKDAVISAEIRRLLSTNRALLEPSSSPD